MKKYLNKKNAMYGALLIGLVLAVVYREKIKSKFYSIKGKVTGGQDEEMKEEETQVLDYNLMLQKGVKGLEVAELQRNLIKAGANLPNFGIDGDFGEETEAALSAVTGTKAITLNEYISLRNQIKLA